MRRRLGKERESNKSRKKRQTEKERDESYRKRYLFTRIIEGNRDKEQVLDREEGNRGIERQKGKRERKRKKGKRKRGRERDKQNTTDN